MIAAPSSGIKSELTILFSPLLSKTAPITMIIAHNKLRIGIEYKYYREIEDGKGDVHFLGNRTLDFAQLI